MLLDRVQRGRGSARAKRRRRAAVVAAPLAAAIAIALASVLSVGTIARASAHGGGASLRPTGNAARHRHHGHHRRAPLALRGRGMWIWQLSSSEGANLVKILAKARAYGVSTVFIKSSDGRAFWPFQFSAAVVHALRSRGLRVCAWQFVYGERPIREAQLGARAVHDGANCLVIDAEAQYEGRYIAAQTYIRRLRALIGPRFPVALAGFPYVDFHPGFPYSVFLGPGGAQYNMPQMYWRAIGTTVDGVFAHTYAFNRIYQRKIFPLGQVYGSTPAAQIERFRSISRAYHATGVSWWDWQSARLQAWQAMSRPVGDIPGYVAHNARAAIGRGAVGDVVVWAQEHLVAAGYPVKISGKFKHRTFDDVVAFQRRHRLAVDGIIGPQTWGALLRYRPIRVNWVAAARVRTSAAKLRSAELAAAHGSRAAISMPVPASASAPDRGNELRGAPGAGG